MAMLLAPGLLWGETVATSDIDDQVSVQMTVYNSNIGLVKDTRKITLPPGEGELWFMDVASHIMPETVHTKSTNRPNDWTVLEQNYEYDLMNGKKLLDKYVGKRIKVIDWNRYQDRKDTIDALLLSNNQDQVYRINNEIYLGHPGIKVLPELPQNLIAKPTLTWLYENGSRRPHHLQVSYLTRHITWRSDYILVLNKDDDAGDLSGWVTVDNKSGASYRNARLKLVAGEVNRVDEPQVYAMAEMAASRKAKAAPFKEDAFFEYHIYNLQRKTTIKNKQTKQIRLLEAHGITVQKELLVHGIQGYFSRKYSTRELQQPVNVYVKFNNAKKNQMGMPLPAGIMRIYKADNEGSLQFIGEDRISHTPKDETVKLKIGEAFDIVAERTQSDYRQLTTRRHESEWEITIRNHKDQTVRVSLIEPVFGNWEVIKSSHEYVKEDAFTLRFNIAVPGDGTEKVSYRIRVGL